MKINKITAFLLACFIMVAMVAFSSCEDGDEALTTGNDSSDTSSENDAPSSDEPSNNDPDSDSEINQEALQALKDAFERSSQSKNYTLTGTVSGISSGTENGEDFLYYEIQNMTQIQKVDGDKREAKETETAKYSPNDPWKTQTRWSFDKYTSENSGISYHWNEETESWSTGSFSSVEDSNSSNLWDGKLEDIYSQLQYNESTGLYSLAEYNADDVAIEFFLGRNIEIESGEATARYRDIEIELRDGYIYRIHMVLDVRVDIVIENQGEMYFIKGELLQTQTSVFSDYGTTVVTLPVVD